MGKWRCKYSYHVLLCLSSLSLLLVVYLLQYEIQAFWVCTINYGTIEITFNLTIRSTSMWKLSFPFNYLRWNYENYHLSLLVCNIYFFCYYSNLNIKLKMWKTWIPHPCVCQYRKASCQQMRSLILMKSGYLWFWKLRFQPLSLALNRVLLCP